MTNLLLGLMLFMAIASAGMAAGAIIGVKRNGVDLFADGNGGRVVVLAVIMAMSWWLLGQTLVVTGLGGLVETFPLVMGALGVVVGAMPIAFAFDFEKVE